MIGASFAWHGLGLPLPLAGMVGRGQLSLNPAYRL
jgi:hypothetical protein